MAQRKGDTEGRDALIAEYRDYVHSIVGTLIHSMGLPATFFDEFVSAGYLGLVEAASRFDFKSGREFKNFAFLRIRGAVIDNIRECADCSGTAYRQVKALQAAQELREDAGAPANLGEVFEYASKGLLAFRLTLLDVEEEVTEESGGTPDPETELMQKQNLEKIRAVIATLPENERLVIEEFYFRDRSFTEIANDHIGHSKSWVSRLHAKALAALRDALLDLERGEPVSAEAR